MAHIDDLMEVTSTKFHLAMLAAKRAREINNYYQQLGEGSGRYVAPLISTEANKPLTIALEEIAQGKIVEAEPQEVVTDDPLAFIGEEELDGEALDAAAPSLSAVPDELAGGDVLDELADGPGDEPADELGDVLGDEPDDELAEDLPTGDEEPQAGPADDDAQE